MLIEHKLLEDIDYENITSEFPKKAWKINFMKLVWNLWFMNILILFSSKHHCPSTKHADKYNI